MRARINLRVTADPSGLLKHPMTLELSDGEIAAMERLLEAGIAVTAAAPGKAGAARAVAQRLILAMRAVRAGP